MEEFQDHYAILGVPFGAPHQEIKRTYRLAVRRLHPDNAEFKDEWEKTWATDQMKKINHARDVLLDPAKRSDYDRRYGERQAPGQQQSQTRSQPSSQQPQRPARRRCPLCEGTGSAVCLICNGLGSSECPGCSGSGQVTCPICQGSGWVSAAEYERHVREAERANRQTQEAAERHRAAVEARQREAETRRVRTRQVRSLAQMFGLAVLLVVVTRSCIFSGTPPRAQVPGEPSSIASPAQESIAPPAPRPTLYEFYVTSLFSLRPVQDTLREEHAMVSGAPYGRSFVRSPCCHRMVVAYNLEAQYTRFQAYAGIADGSPAFWSGAVKVVGDGKPLFQSQAIRVGEASRIDVSIAGIRHLELVTTVNQRDAGIWWLEPRLIRE